MLRKFAQNYCVEFITVLTQVNLIHLEQYNKSLLQIVTSTFVVDSKDLTVQIFSQLRTSIASDMGAKF